MAKGLVDGTELPALVPSVARGVVVPLEHSLDAALLGLLHDYRLLVREVTREALRTGKTALGSMSRYARDRALVHRLTGQHAVVAAEVGLSLAKAHRRRLQLGLPAELPFISRLFLRTNPATFHLDLDSGKVRLSLRNGEWGSFVVRLSAYSRQRLSDPAARIKQLHLTPDHATFTVERSVPEPFHPSSLLALDTNESSVDGVQVSAGETHAVVVPFSDIRSIQATHSTRRRRLAHKKSTERRVGRRLLGREGQRERHRVRSRLHVLTRALVLAASRHHSAIALEDFSKLIARRPRRRPKRSGRGHQGKGGAPRSPSLRRRLSAWPRRELHRQIEYKAAEHGVPIYWVNPFRTSTTCPKCGEYAGPRSRVGPTFACANPSCGWILDRQLNAGANIGRTVLRDYGRTELGGLRLDLDALSREALRPRYPFEKFGRARAERTEREGHARVPTNKLVPD